MSAEENKPLAENEASLTQIKVIPNFENDNYSS